MIAGGFGFGTLIGALAGIRVRPKYPMRFGTLCVFALSAIPLALLFAVPVWVAAVAGFAAGSAGQVFGIIWYTALQKNIPPQMLSRVSAYDHLGSIGLAPLGIVVAGYLYETQGANVTLLAAAALIVVPTVLVLLVKDVRMMRDRAFFE